MTMTDKVKVTNRNRGITGYTIPDLNNLHRDFQPGETKVVDKEEIFKLSQFPGGRYMLANYLVIHDSELIEEIFGEVEPEYFYSKDDIKRVMTTGTLEEFEDMLNFSPIGGVELIKQMAVDLPLNDIAKRDLIFRKTGFNVSQAIDIAKDSEQEEVFKPIRKANTPKQETTSSSTPVRKAVVPTAKK